mgnify:FL=1
MNIYITKGARQYGYLIWNKKMDVDIDKMLVGLTAVDICFNGFNLGEKNIDRKYHRISLGYKLTRALPKEHDTFSVSYIDGVLEVKSFDGRK